MAKIAGCHIEYDGQEYNWGDEVPQEVIDAFPTAVVDKPLTSKEIDTMGEDELREALNAAHGNATATATQDVGGEVAASGEADAEKGGAE